MTRKAYPSDLSDDEWAFVACYLTLMREDAPQRDHPLREVFSGPRHIVHTSMLSRPMAHDLPPWYAVYQQTQRWKAGVFEDMVGNLSMLMREINDGMPFRTAGGSSRRREAAGVLATMGTSGTGARRCIRRLIAFSILPGHRFVPSMAKSVAGSGVAREELIE